MRHNPHSILLDTGLQYNAASTCMFDWMHSWCIDGVLWRTFNSLMLHLQDAAAEYGFIAPTGEHLHNYMQKWTWPRHYTDAALVFETGDLANLREELEFAEGRLARLSTRA